MTTTTNTSTRRRRSQLLLIDDEQADGPRSSIAAAGLTAGGTTSAGRVLSDWLSARAQQMAFWEKRRGGEKKEEEAARVAAAAAAEAPPPKVSLLALFAFSTRREKGWMLLGLGAAGIAGLAMPVWLYLLADSLQTFNNIGKIVGAGGDISILSDKLYSLIYSFAGVGAVSLFAGATYVAVFTYTGERQTLRIRECFVRSAFRQEAAWFDARGDPQELPTLAANALTRINTAIGRSVADTVANLLSAVGSLAISLVLNTKLALFMLCMLPIIGVVIAIVSHFMRQKSGQSLEQFAAAGAFATEVISGIKTVASLCAEPWAVARYDSTARLAEKYSIHSGFLAKLASGLMGLLFYGTYVFAFIFGTEQAARTGEVEQESIPFYCMFNYCGISGSEVMVCIYGVILTAQFFALLSPGIQATNLGRTAAVDIFGAIHRTPAIDGSSDRDGKKLSNYDGSIEFRDLSFSYPTRPSDLIFKNFNLTIQPGTAVALVGPSGSGKSTISRLLLRLYDPFDGHVLAGGTPLTELNLRWWRSQIGYVPQEPSLFPGTIRENIASGKPKEDGPATDNEVVAAAKAACAHDFISSLPDGYDTFNSGASIQLSGGQIQRIAIARAMIRNPTILLLDEATSALDTESEKVVQDALARIRESRKLTTVTVAHRLTTIVSSDQIAVIAEGSIQELGTHDALLKEDGIYAALCLAQGIGPTKGTASTPQDASNLPGSPSRTIVGRWKGDEHTSTTIEVKGNAEDIEAAVGQEAPAEIEDVEEGEEEEVAPVSRLWKYNAPEACYIFIGLVGGVIVGALPPCEGILFGKITSNLFELEPDPMRDENRTLSLIFFALAGAALFGNMLLGYGFSVSGFRLTRRLRVKVFEKILRQPMGWFDVPEHSTGELTTMLEEDAEAVSNVTGWQMGQKIQIASSLASGLVISLSFSWQIGLTAIACVPFIVGAAALQAMCTKRLVYRDTETLSAATILERGFHDISVLQAYNLQDDVSNQYSSALKPDAAYKVKQGIYSGLVFGFSQFATFSTFALLFWAGIKLMVNGKVTFQDFFVALLAVMFAAFGVGQANADFGARRKGLVAAARMFSILDEPEHKDDPMSKTGKRPDSLEGTLSFQSCSFSYPTRPDFKIFYRGKEKDGFSLDIASKQSVAFTGRSGCGKSTALQLVLRFYEVTSGDVLLDGENVQGLNMSWLRSNTGYVGQQPVLFNGSIRSNILLGKPEATDEEVVNAAKAANAHDFVTQLSSGYDTEIGAGGSLLSGGQKQRIAIARAIIRDPRILVLDEATSALDNESEKIVQAALDKMQQTNPRTTLTVAHRLTTIKECDKIVVLGDGGVKESGSHDELMQRKGLYYSLWQKQGAKTDSKTSS